MEDFFQGLWKTFIEYWYLISTITIAINMALLRTVKANGKFDWIEAGICGLFSYAVWASLSWLNIPEGASVLVGGVIGHVGSVRVGAWLSQKFGLDNVKDKSGEKNEQ